VAPVAPTPTAEAMRAAAAAAHSSAPSCAATTVVAATALGTSAPPSGVVLRGRSVVALLPTVPPTMARRGRAIAPRVSARPSWKTSAPFGWCHRRPPAGQGAAALVARRRGGGRASTMWRCRRACRAWQTPMRTCGRCGRRFGAVGLGPRWGRRPRGAGGLRRRIRQRVLSRRRPRRPGQGLGAWSARGSLGPGLRGAAAAARRLCVQGTRDGCV